MKPETGAALAKARDQLAKARKIYGADVYDEAARLAYLVAFHAARALLFERTGTIYKRHETVSSQFGAQSYVFKMGADYDNSNPPISPDQAQAAIAGAEHFLTRIAALLPP